MIASVSASGESPQFDRLTVWPCDVVSTATEPMSIVDGVAVTPAGSASTARLIVSGCASGMSVVTSIVDAAEPASVGATVTLNVTVFAASPSTDAGSIGVVSVNGAAGCETAVSLNAPASFATSANI